MDPCMYVFLNRGAGMTPGKLAAQASHAAVEAYRDAKLPAFGNKELELQKEWLKAGHYKKLTLLAEDEVHLLTIERYLQERGIRTYLIIDEGLTEVRAHTATALGVPLVDKDDPEIQAIFSTFKLYREPKQAAADSGKARRRFWQRRRKKP
jgi:peptidyl-tRNA hydrolase